MNVPLPVKILSLVLHYSASRHCTLRTPFSQTQFKVNRRHLYAFPGRMLSTRAQCLVFCCNISGQWNAHLNVHLLRFCFFFFKFILWKRASEHEWRKGRERGSERIPSRLHTVSAEPDVGPEVTKRWDWTLNPLSHSGAPVCWVWTDMCLKTPDSCQDTEGQYHHSCLHTLNLNFLPFIFSFWHHNVPKVVSLTNSHMPSASCSAC